MASQNNNVSAENLGDLKNQGPILRPKKASSGGSSEEELDGSYLEESTQPFKSNQRHQESISMNPHNIQPGEMLSLSESMQGAYNFQHSGNSNAQPLTESDLYQQMSAVGGGVNLDGQVQSFSMNDTDFDYKADDDSSINENEGSLDEAGNIGQPVEDDHQELSAEEDMNELHHDSDEEGDHVSQSENAEADQYLEMESAESDQLHHGSQHFEEESSQRYEPEGQYQGAYDRNLPGAQGYAPVMPPMGYGQAPLVAVQAQDRHEPVRQWVLNIDPNPNPEDDQMIDISFSSDHGDRYGFPGGQNIAMQRPGLSNSDPDLARRNVGVVNPPHSVPRIGGQGASSGDLARADVLGQSQNSTVNMPANSSYHQIDDVSNYNQPAMFEVMGTQTDMWTGAEDEGHDSMEAETQTSTLGTQDQSVGTDWAHLVVRQAAGPGQASTQPQLTHTAMSPPIVASSHRSSSQGDGSVHSALGASQQSLLSNQGSAGSSVQVNKHPSGAAGSLKLSQQSISHPVTVSKVTDKTPSMSQNTIDSGIGDSQLLNRPRTVHNNKAADKKSENRHSQCVQIEGNTDVSQRQTPQGAIPKERPLAGSKTNKTSKTSIPTAQKQDKPGNGSKVTQRNLSVKSTSQQKLPQGQQKSSLGQLQKASGGTSTTQNRTAPGSNTKNTSGRQAVTGDSRSAGGGGLFGGQKSASPATAAGSETRSPPGQRNVPSMSQHLADQGVNISPIKTENDCRSIDHRQQHPQQRAPVSQSASNRGPSAFSSYTTSQQQSRQRIDFDGEQQSEMSEHTRPCPNVEAVEQILNSIASNTSEQVSTLQSFNCSSDIDNVMQVREHLQAILNSQPPSDSPSAQHQYGDNLYSVHQPQAETRQGYVRGNTVGQDSNRRTGNLHPFNSDSGSFEQMLAYSSKYFTSESLNMETKFFKDALEKEQFRRKHCEELIQDLQRKQLESQEQLAVAMEMDRKKDHMIQQLDKTLAVVVEKWKKAESDRLQKMSEMQNENEKLKQNQLLQEQVVNRLENELKATFEKLGSELKKAKDSAREREEQLHYKTEESQMMAQELQLQRTRNDTLSSECQCLNERLDKLNTQFAMLKEAYDEEYLVWEEKEKDYLQKIEDITENHMKVVEEGKEKLSNQTNEIEEKQGVLTATQKHNKQLEIELDTVARERESLKVQLGLLEAKFESNHRKLEAEFQSQLETKINEQQELLQRRFQENDGELRERHKQQVYQLNAKHNRDTEAQMVEIRNDLQKREDRYREKERQLQEIVSELKGEVEDLKESLRGYESQRSELASKLPAMMQAHCNEALRMLQQGKNTTLTLGPLYNPALPIEVPSSSTVNSHSMVYNPSNNSATMARTLEPQPLFTVASNSSHPPDLSHPTTRGMSPVDQDTSLFSAVSEAINPSDVSGVSEHNSTHPMSAMLKNLLANQGHLSRFVNGYPEGVSLSLPPNIQSSVPSTTTATTSSSSMSHTHNQQQHYTVSNLHSNTNSLFNNSKAFEPQHPQEPMSLNLKPVRYEGTLRAHRDLEVNGGNSNSSPWQHKENEETYERTAIRIHFKDDLELVSTQHQKPQNNLVQRHISLQHGDSDKNKLASEQYGSTSKTVSHASENSHNNVSLHFDRDLLQSANKSITSQLESETPNTMFHDLSAQNHQGMEFIRKQIEEQRSSESSGVIQLHPPVQLDLSSLQATHTVTVEQQQQHHSSGSSGSERSQPKVTWRLAETSFEATEMDKQHARQEMQPHADEDERSVDYSDMAQRFDQHESRQAELQRYIKMLLQKPPSSPTEESPTQPQQQAPVPGAGGLSPSQVGEISRLVGMYKQTEQVSQDMQDVLSYLKEAQENRYEQPEQPGMSPPSPPTPQGQPPESPRKPLGKARRNLEATYKVSNSKQATKPIASMSNNEKPKQSNVPSLNKPAPPPHTANNKPNGATTGKTQPQKKAGPKKGGDKNAPAWK